MIYCQHDTNTGVGKFTDPCVCKYLIICILTDYSFVLGRCRNFRICVYDADGESMLLIIECKTYGKEYKNALKILHNDGGQLFSYWQQERSTKWISLYASGIVDDSLVYENDIINCSKGTHGN